MSRRVESSGDEEDLGEDASKQGRRINAIDADEDITLVSVQDDDNAERKFTLAQALVALKSVKPKVKGVVIEEPSVPVSVAKKVDADYQLAERLQAEEKEQFTIEEKATLFKKVLEQRRKHFAAKRAEEKRNKPPTKTQQKKTMITYLKNMEGWKHKDLKSKDFDSIKELFDKAFKRVNMFVDFRTDLVEGSSKRAGKELEQESTKKQKVDEKKRHNRASKSNGSHSR
ncbi:hypothetical protein Tco_1503533 [Tanacetum coccineum]